MLWIWNYLRIVPRVICFHHTWLNYRTMHMVDLRTEFSTISITHGKIRWNIWATTRNSFRSSTLVMAPSLSTASTQTSVTITWGRKAVMLLSQNGQKTRKTLCLRCEWRSNPTQWAWICLNGLTWSSVISSKVRKHKWLKIYSSPTLTKASCFLTLKNCRRLRKKGIWARSVSLVNALCSSSQIKTPWTNNTTLAIRRSSSELSMLMLNLRLEETLETKWKAIWSSNLSWVNLKLKDSIHKS